SGLRPLRAGAAAAREKGAREVEVMAGEAVVGAVEAVGAVAGLEGLVAAVGVVEAAAEEAAGVGAVVGAAVDAAAAGAVVEVVAAAVVAVEALAVARASSTLRRPRSFVSGTLSTGGGGGLSCTYVIRTGDRTGQTCGRAHTTQRCFSRLDDAWRTQFPTATELPRWADLMKKNIDIYALDFDAILTAMYVLSTSGEGAQYLRVPPDPGIRTSEAAALGASASVALGAGEAAAPGIRVSATPGAGEAAALGASESAPPGTESTEALHTFTLDSGASRCFFRDRTALEQLARPVAVSLADPSGGPVIATSSTVLPCPAVPSGTLSGLHLPSFSTNLVAGCALQDGGVHQFTPAYERVTHCTCAWTGRHLATFTRQPGQLSAPCSCRSLAHETVLWHHRLGHPSVQRLRGMHKRYLVSGLPRVLPPLPPSPAPPCLPCVEGRQRAAPHSSSFSPTTAPLQTLHMDVWGPARVRGQGQERYFLIVVDDYSRYTTVFPLRTKGEVPDVLIPWIRASRLQLSERFYSDFPVLRLHSDRGGEFSDLLAAYCAEHGIRQSFTLPASPQQNGVAERRIGLVMEVARTSLIHAAAPHFLWPFAVRYAAHQLNLWPRVSLPETSPTLRWTGEVGDASRFWDVTFDESVPYYRLFPYRTAPLPPPPLFLAPGAAVVDPLPPQGAAPSGATGGAAAASGAAGAAGGAAGAGAAGAAGGAAAAGAAGGAAGAGATGAAGGAAGAAAAGGAASAGAAGGTAAAGGAAGAAGGAGAGAAGAARGTAAAGGAAGAAGAGGATGAAGPGV
ncbi:unnamed protein product, partial [Closterium sp. Naga37s-1]